VPHTRPTPTTLFDCSPSSFLYVQKDWRTAASGNHPPERRLPISAQLKRQRHRAPRCNQTACALFGQHSLLPFPSSLRVRQTCNLRGPEALQGSAPEAPSRSDPTSHIAASARHNVELDRPSPRTLSHAGSVPSEIGNTSHRLP